MVRQTLGRQSGREIPVAFAWLAALVIGQRTRQRLGNLLWRGGGEIGEAGWREGLFGHSRTVGWT